MTPANAPQVPPPDRPETTSSEQILQDRITQAVDVIAREGRTYNAVAAEAALRREVSATYAALEAVKAENATLREELQDALSTQAVYKGHALEARSSLAEAQALVAAVEAWYNGDDMTLAEAWVTYRNAARSGRKETE